MQEVERKVCFDESLPPALLVFVFLFLARLKLLVWVRLYPGLTLQVCMVVYRTFPRRMSETIEKYHPSKAEQESYSEIYEQVYEDLFFLRSGKESMSLPVSPCSHNHYVPPSFAQSEPKGKVDCTRDQPDEESTKNKYFPSG